MKSKLAQILVAIIISLCGLTTLGANSVFADENGTAQATTESTDVCSQPDIPDAVKAAAGCPSNTDIDENTFKNNVINIINAVIAISGLIAVIFVVIGGINFMTSTGDAGKVKKAKDTILYAAIGLVICALSFAIVNFVIANLNKTDTDPSQAPGFMQGAGE